MLRRIVASGLMLLAVRAVPAAEVQTQGLAPLDNQSRGSARLQAMQDAERRASELPGMRIVGGSRSNGLSTTQSQGEGRLGASRITGESNDNGLLQIDAAVTVNPGSACPASIYRKKLVVADFGMAHSDQATDIIDAGRGFAMELLRALEKTRQYQVRNAITVSVFPDPNLAPAVDKYGDPRTVVALGRKMDAQFVIAGNILDLSAHDSAYTHGANEVTSLFGFHLEPMKRGLRIGLYVFDSLTGNVMLQQTYDRTVYGDTYFANPMPFNSREFQQSQLGDAVQQIIAQQVNDIAAQINCLPLMERIVRVEKPFVYINAGSASNIHVGDTLAVYHQLNKPLPGVYYQNERLLGYSEEMKTTLTITQVQPSFAVGRLELESAPVDPMDLVRSW